MACSNMSVDGMESEDLETAGEMSKCAHVSLFPDEGPSAPFPEPTKDHCDLLLDAIDAHLAHLQEQRAEVRKDVDCGGAEQTSTAYVNQSVSKDTGLGDAVLSNDTVTIPLNGVHFKDQDSERDTGKKNRMTKEEENMEAAESKKEQCRWRLERLLGSSSAGFEGDMPLSTDSVRTEDFAVMFEEAMVFPLIQTRVHELGGRGALEDELLTLKDHQEKHQCRPLGGEVLKQPCKQSKCLDTFYSPDSQPSGKTHLNVKEFSRVQFKMQESQHQVPKRTKAQLSAENRVHHVAGPRGQSQKCSHAGQSGEPSGTPAGHEQSSDKGVSSVSGKPGDTCKTPTERVCYSFTPHSLKHIASPGTANKTATGPGCPSSSEVHTLSQSCVRSSGAPEERSPQLKVRSLAGVPVCSFDTVTIDSDLDSVRTDQVRGHLHSVLNSSAAVRSARCFQAGDLSSDQSDLDTRPLGQRLRLGSAWRARGETLSGARSVRKCHQPRKGSRRVKLVLSDDDEESDKVHTERGGPHRWRSAPDVQSRELGLQNLIIPPRRQAGRNRLAITTDMRLEGTGFDRRLQENLSSLRKECVREEEKLVEKRAQLQETELSLTVLLQQKKHALQELESVQAAVQRAERESRDWEASLKESRSQLHSQHHTNSCLQEASAQEQELSTRHNTRGTDTEGSAALTVLEREELDRQLDRAKTDLFAEQRRARVKVDSLKERLEETQQELDLHMESERTLRERCSYLEEQLKHAARQREVQEHEQAAGGSPQALEVQLHRLQVEVEEQAGRAGALERLLAQKELQLLGTCEEQAGLRAEIRVLKEQHAARLREAQEHTQREKERELELLRSELTSAQKLQVQQVLKQDEEEKLKALKEQALIHSQHTDTLENSIQLKDEEIRKLTEALEQQREELLTESQKMVHQAIEEENKKWDAEKEEIQKQHMTVEEQGQREVEGAKKEMERERKTVLTLQNQVLELQNRVQELEAEGWRLRRQQASALSDLRRNLMEEQQAELQQLRKHNEQEERREVHRLQKALEQADGELRVLRGSLAERTRSQEEDSARVEQQHRGWAHALGSECQRLQELLEQTGCVGATAQHQDSLTVAQAVQALRALGEQLHALVSHLQQELDMQRHTTHRLALEKEHELRRQRERMEKEKEQALNLLREHLVKEHMEELSGVQRDRLRDNGGEAGGLVASLRRQLRNKDAELREVQRNMGHWKEQTASRMARKFEEELTAELERCKAELLKERRAMRSKELKEMKRLEDDMMRLTMEHCGSVPGPSLYSKERCSNPTVPDLASLKLLRHLQVRIRQLRAESWGHTCTPSHLATAGDLAGSYLEMIVPPVDRIQARSRCRTRTIHS